MNLYFAKLKKLNIRPSALTTDDVFMRRVYLDTIGRLPTPKEIKAFLSDANPDKRSNLIDMLLDTPEWVNLRTLKLADMLRIHPADFRERCLRRTWRNALSRMGYIRQFQKIDLTTRSFKNSSRHAGSTYQHGPANYYRIEQQPAGRAETTAQVFLGIRLSCARCHKHPFDQWTTDDYWNFAAFTGKVGTRGGRNLQRAGCLL